VKRFVNDFSYGVITCLSIIPGNHRNAFFSLWYLYELRILLKYNGISYVKGGLVAILNAHLLLLCYPKIYVHYRTDASGGIIQRLRCTIEGSSVMFAYSAETVT
jgi:hypothetical protein